MNTSHLNVGHTEEPLLQWIQTLDAWYNHAMVSTPDEATHCIWEGDLQKRDDWLRKGHRLFVSYQHSIERAHELTDVIERMDVDPYTVAQQLEYQDWYVVVRPAVSRPDDNYYEVPNEWTHVVWLTSDTNAGSGSMHSYWNEVVGQAMALSNRWSAHSDNTAVLKYGLELFHIDEEGNYQSKLVNESHVASMRALCKQHTWAQDTIAQWVLADVAGSAPWFGSFDETLGNNPSALLLDTIYTVHESTYGHGRLHKLQELAPAFFADAMRLYAMYTTLCGAPPDDFEAACEYKNARRDWLEQTCQANNWGSSPTSPSMDSAFFEALPSSAV